MAMLLWSLLLCLHSHYVLTSQLTQPSLPNPSPHNCATYGFPATFNFYLKYYGLAGLAGLGFSICSLFSPNQSTTSAFEVSNKSSTFIHEFLFLFGFVYPSCEYVTVHYFHGKLPFDCLMNLLLLSTCNSPFLQTQSSCWKEKLQIMLWYVCKYFEWQTMIYAKTQLDRIPLQSA